MARRFRHAHHVDEKFQALVRFRRKHFHVGEMREVKDRFWLHLFFPFEGWRYNLVPADDFSCCDTVSLIASAISCHTNFSPFGTAREISAIVCASQS